MFKKLMPLLVAGDISIFLKHNQAINTNGTITGMIFFNDKNPVSFTGTAEELDENIDKILEPVKSEVEIHLASIEKKSIEQKEKRTRKKTKEDSVESDPNETSSENNGVKENTQEANFTPPESDLFSEMETAPVTGPNAVKQESKEAISSDPIAPEGSGIEEDPEDEVDDSNFINDETDF